MIDAFPTSTLLERALIRLADAPQSAAAIARDVLGLTNAPRSVADRLAAALLGSDPRTSQLPDGRWALIAAASGSPMLDECAFAVVDVETTGSRALGDRVLEVGVVVVQGPRRELIYDRVVNPERPVPWAITNLTRITEAEAKAAPLFEDQADEVIGALAGRVFVAHNVRFDWGFIASELRRTRGFMLSGPRLCTARLARRLVPAAESCGLDWLTQYFDLRNPARHRAGGDAWATAELLLKLLDLARAEGARTFADLEALQNRKRRGRRKKSAMPGPIQGEARAL